MKLKDIMFTDCYVEFDSNEQMRNFIANNNIKIWHDEKCIYESDLLLSFFKSGHIGTGACILREIPVHHHSTIEL